MGPQFPEVGAHLSLLQASFLAFKASLVFKREKVKS